MLARATWCRAGAGLAGHPGQHNADVDVVELVVNGVVVERIDGVEAGETREYRGQVDLPAGGWVAVRAYASDPQDDAWPTMHARPFAHTSPVWIEAVGSTEPGARRQAAADLLRAIDAAERRAPERLRRSR
jgi:TolB protein